MVNPGGKPVGMRLCGACWQVWRTVPWLLMEMLLLRLSLAPSLSSSPTEQTQSCCSLTACTEQIISMQKSLQLLCTQLVHVEGKMSTEFDFRTIISSQTSIMGDLRQLLSQGEYAPFTSAPVFESKFVQVNRRGETMNIHKQPTCVTIGICATNPSSPMPYGMLLAHTVPVSPQESVTNFQKFSERSSQLEQLALSRFLPLKFVELSVHSTDNHQLMLKLVNGRSYYLELCAPPDQQHRLFQHWLQLISLLKPQKNPSNTNINIKCKDFGTSREKDPSPNNSSENRANPQDLPNPKTSEEVVPKQTTSNQVPLSVSVGPTEKSGREEVAAFASPLEATRQEIPMQSKNIDPLDTIMSKSKEKRKSRIDKTKPKKEKKSQPSGNRKSGIMSSVGCFK